MLERGRPLRRRMWDYDQVPAEKKIGRFIKPIPIEAIGGMAATQN
jgi:hypothetical protein